MEQRKAPFPSIKHPHHCRHYPPEIGSFQEKTANCDFSRAAVFDKTHLAQRNLFELSVVSFLICVASELRVIAGSEKEIAPVQRLEKIAA